MKAGFSNLQQLILSSGSLNSVSDKDTKSRKNAQESAKKKVEKDVMHEVEEISDSTRYACAWALMSARMTIC
jgi:hypothetical protein|eukprot:CAMPEP_0173070864 /NCGR_PEP_ID=MMETSP1102-20130122/8877_1 /TAXON_ID=49646 /ORGANISM="Geminigera sp., Strain Caron Lab Isolate" /LENGTH=71 /DNA_ID=CAMNT_0013939227 /DNA_START=149 /DNA_END=364 /DNA_ORIENTATION=+